MRNLEQFETVTRNDIKKSPMRNLDKFICEIVANFNNFPGRSGSKAPMDLMLHTHLPVI